MTVSSIALYYPWMHFQDDNWLKLALLTWDRVARMRPLQTRDGDEELVHRLKAETDFIVETAPSPTILGEVADTFLEILGTDLERVRAYYGLAPSSSGGDWPDRRRYAADWFMFEPPPSQGPWQPEYEPVPGGFLLPIPVEGPGTKIASRLGDQLAWSGLGERRSSWIGLHPKLGSIYLAVLADAVARSEFLLPATDDLRVHHAIGATDRLTGLLFDQDVRVPALEDVESAYVSLALRTVIEPASLDQTPVAKLIRFREDHRAELVAFQEHVAGLAPKLQAIAQVERLETAVAHLDSLYKSATKPQLDELRRALRGLGIESSAGAMAQKVDLTAAGGTLLGGVAAAGGQLAVAGAAVAVTLVPYVASKARARNQQVRSSPVAYLLAADRTLNGRALLRAPRPGAPGRAPSHRRTLAWWRGRNR
ncbi:DUF6236 family protein [Kitasatospora sp. NPDC056531]|uniref:DUF6236 family protein n=1 Tax=Kitasatospora sp. NPDC056531 TaxID=3345856 RepID=UPI00369B0A54